MQDDLNITATAVKIILNMTCGLYKFEKKIGYLVDAGVIPPLCQVLARCIDYYGGIFYYHGPYLDGMEPVKTTDNSFLIFFAF